MFGLVPRRAEPRTGTLTPQAIRDEFAPIFDRFFGTWPMLFEPWATEGVRDFSMTEDEKEVLVRAELPGFEPNEVEVMLRGCALVIEAKHGEEPKGEKGKVEHDYAHVKRSVTLPEGLDLDKLEAAYRNGVLEVRVPRKPEATGRRIDVKV